MPDVQNVFRRGGAYWWRRTLTWWDGNARPITLSLSLGTKDLGVARHRAAAMTAQSEVVRMSLYERVARDGLTIELQRIRDNDAEQVDARTMLTELLADNRALAETIREAKRLADEAGDNATSVLADDWTDAAERRAWFLGETVGPG